AGARHRQLFLPVHAHVRPRLGDGRRRVRLRRPGVFLGRVPGHEQRRARGRRGRRRAARTGARGGAAAGHGPAPEARAQALFLVHPPLHHAGDAAPVLRPAQRLEAGAGGDLDARRRRVRQSAGALAAVPVQAGVRAQRGRDRAAGAARLAQPPPPGPGRVRRRHPARRQPVSRPAPLPPGPPPHLRVEYVGDADAARLLARDDVLAVLGFGSAARRLDGPRYLRVPLERHGDAALEIWHASAPVRSGREPVAGDMGGEIAWACDGQLLFGAIEVDEPAGHTGDGDNSGIVLAAEHAYRSLTRFIAAGDHPHLLRIWNYLDAITLGDGDAERYRRFCVGRARGLGDFDAGTLPAATAIGRCDDARTIQVYWLAARTPGTPVENPRQVSAYRYPREYGPQPPSFARAMLPPPGARMPLLLSGTAAVVGHASRHTGELLAQLEETFANF